jgi:hypothetical protein
MFFKEWILLFVYIFLYYPSQHNNYQDVIHVTSVKFYTLYFTLEK